jgi:pimeloyl-ACP methyl ester carboxylesterase
MQETYKMSDDTFIAYKHYKSKNNLPCVVFLHGLMSNISATKSVYLQDYCISKDISFLAFDNFGCGNSSGVFQEQTMGIWIDAASKIIQALTQNNAILAGSSAGAWAALELAMTIPNIAKALICIAPAPDFTEDMWRSLSPDEQQHLRSKGQIDIEGYPMTYRFIKEARQHLLFDKPHINIDCPVHLIHGICDATVPYAVSMKLCDKISASSVSVKLIKDGDHRLSRPQDLKIISNSLEEIMHLLSI